MHAQLSSGAQDLIFDLSINLLPYFIYASRKGSGKTALKHWKVWRLAACICFKYSYLISNVKLSRVLKIRYHICSLYTFLTVKIKYVYHVIYLLTCDEVKHSYGKCSKSSNFYHSLFSNKVLPKYLLEYCPVELLLHGDVWSWPALSYNTTLKPV